jgi:hypothetical protein
VAEFRVGDVELVSPRSFQSATLSNGFPICSIHTGARLAFKFARLDHRERILDDPYLSSLRSRA